MKQSIFTGWLLLLGIVSAVNSSLAQQEKSSSSDKAQQNARKELRAANNQFYAALNSMFTGDVAPMDAIWSHRDDVTQMGPFGGRLTGWKAVGAEFKKVAGMKLGGHVACKDLVIQAGTDMGYTICVEQGENMGADGKPVMVSHRVTNIFRLENGQWKLVHHHTDISPQLEKVTGEAH